MLILVSSEEKIDLIDKKLSRLNRLVESLITDNSVGSMGISLNHQDNLDSALASQDMPSRSMPVGSPTSEVIAINAQSSSNRVGARPNEITNQVTICEGQSSLKAHSAFAIDFAHYVVGSSQPPGQDNHEIGQLLDTLHHIKNASDDHRFSSKPLFPLVHATTSPNHEQYDMPPLRAAVQLLREAEGTLHNYLCIPIYWLLLYRQKEFYIPWVMLFAEPRKSVRSMFEGLLFFWLLRCRVYHCERNFKLWARRFLDDIKVELI